MLLIIYIKIRHQYLLLMSGIFLTIFINCQLAYGDNRMAGYVTDFGTEIKDEIIFYPSESFIDNTEEFLLESNLEGTQIFTPNVIDISEYENLPLLWLTSHSDLRQWRVIQEQNSFIILTNLYDGTTLSVNAYPSHKRRKPQFRGRSSTGSPRKNSEHVFSAGVKHIDIRSLTEIPWVNGIYSITMITYDWKSNTEKVQLSSRTNNDNPATSINKRVNTFNLTQVGEDNSNVVSIKISDKKNNEDSISMPEKFIFDGKTLSGKISIPIQKDTIFSFNSEDKSNKTSFIKFAIILSKLDEQNPHTFNVSIPISDNDINKRLDIEFKINNLPQFDYSPDIKQQILQAYIVHKNNVLGPIPLIGNK